MRLERLRKQTGTETLYLDHSDYSVQRRARPHCNQLPVHVRTRPQERSLPVAVSTYHVGQRA